LRERPFLEERGFHKKFKGFLRKNSPRAQGCVVERCWEAQEIVPVPGNGPFLRKEGFILEGAQKN